MQQMGVPARTYATSGMKYLAYDEHQVDIVPAFPSVQPVLHGLVWRRLPTSGHRSAMRDDIRGE